jgi:uncharacterized membrane protein YgdD (TMEM256/DUF423 family)
MSRLFLAMGAISGFLAVAFGAFGAHALRERLGEHLLGIYEVGVRYQMYHALALLAVGILLARGASTALHVAGWCFVGGTLVFSGSLYALSLTGVRWLGAITPIGGVAFLVGWACLAWAAWRS